MTRVFLICSIVLPPGIARAEEAVIYYIDGTKSPMVNVTHIDSKKVEFLSYHTGFNPRTGYYTYTVARSGNPLTVNAVKMAEGGWFYKPEGREFVYKTWRDMEDEMRAKAAENKKKRDETLEKVGSAIFQPFLEGYMKEKGRQMAGGK